MARFTVINNYEETKHIRITNGEAVDEITVQPGSRTKIPEGYRVVEQDLKLYPNVREVNFEGTTTVIQNRAAPTPTLRPFLQPTPPKAETSKE